MSILAALPLGGFSQPCQSFIHWWSSPAAFARLHPLASRNRLAFPMSFITLGLVSAPFRRNINCVIVRTATDVCIKKKEILSTSEHSFN